MLFEWLHYGPSQRAEAALEVIFQGSRPAGHLIEEKFLIRHEHIGDATVSYLLCPDTVAWSGGNINTEITSAGYWNRERLWVVTAETT
jgi:hypothetical protein